MGVVYGTSDRLEALLPASKQETVAGNSSSELTASLYATLLCVRAVLWVLFMVFLE